MAQLPQKNALLSWKGFLLLTTNTKYESYLKQKNKKKLRGITQFHSKPHQTDSLNELKTCKLALSCFISLVFSSLFCLVSVLYICVECLSFLISPDYIFRIFFNRGTNQDNIFRSFDASLTMSIEESYNWIFNS